MLNTPGVTLAEAADTSGPTQVFSDSVDGDDGSIDGIATGTQSLFSNFVSSSFTLRFSAAALGTLPTHAGIVWTDIGRNGGGAPFAADLVNNVTFEAFGPTGASLGLIGPFSLGDASISRTTAEDRFIGVINDEGIPPSNSPCQARITGRPTISSTEVWFPSLRQERSFWPGEACC